MREETVTSAFCRLHLKERVCRKTYVKQGVVSGRKLRRYLAVLTFVFMLMSAVTTVGKANEPSPNKQKKIIVVDPGHGGHDKGVRGSEGTLEKAITLSLARVILTELGNTYTVVLTRSDDYWLNIPSRTATANHLKADLFISLHTGGSFLHQANGLTIFYCKERDASSPAIDTAQSRSLKNGNSRTSWDTIQSKHHATGKVLAQLIQNCIHEQIEFMKSTVQGAPLMVLEGADMPAVLIEIGYLTNPREEEKLNDTKMLSAFAKGIHKGIDSFFSKNN